MVASTREALSPSTEANSGRAGSGSKPGHGRRIVLTYQIKPLSCDPAKIKGMSERLIVSHYENNYGGAVKRLNLIDEQLAALDYAKAAGFLINGLKREQLIAMNSMNLVRRCATRWRAI